MWSQPDFPATDKPAPTASAAPPGMVYLLPEVRVETIPPALPSRSRFLPSWVKRAAAFGGKLLNGALGLATLVVGLGVLAALPIFQFLAFGYLLEAMGRVGRSGRLRDGFPGLGLAARVGCALACAWLAILPARYLNDVVADAWLIAPDAAYTARLDRIAGIVGLLTLVHVSLALARGGQTRDFFSPCRNLWWACSALGRRGWLRESLSAIYTQARRFRPRYYFWLGLRGFIGTFLWLLPPSLLLVAGRDNPLLVVLGMLLLVYVVGRLPFLQARFAVEQRLGVMFDRRAARDLLRRAPLLGFFTIFLILALAIPLYAFKVEWIWRDFQWLEAMLFIITIWPLKILLGWTFYQSTQRQQRAHWAWRWPSWGLTTATAFAYAVLVFFTSYVGWNGTQYLFQHHAFLLPSPF